MGKLKLREGSCVCLLLLTPLICFPRLAKLADAPFLKTEATKYTEVGYHGQDVNSIIKDLLDISVNMTKKKIKEVK